MGAGKLRDRVEIQSRASGVDAFGGQLETWVAQYERAAEFVHLGGGEGVEGARIAGREIYKLKLRADAKTRAISADGWRVRDTRRNTVFNVLSVDAVTDAASVYLRVEA